MAIDTYAYWRAALEWRADPKKHAMPDFDKNLVQCAGFYRGQRNEAVAIWWRFDANGNPDQCLAQVHPAARTGLVKPAIRNYDRADQIGEQVFAYCCRYPITKDAYWAFVKDGRWPEDVVHLTRAERREIAPPPPQNDTGTDRDESSPSNSDQSRADDASPEQAFSNEIADLVAGVEGWLDSIGRKITEKPHADKLANYAVVAQDIEKRADDARQTEKRPHLQAERAVDAKWQPVVQRAGKIKANLKALLTPYLSAEKRKADEAAAEAMKERHAAIERGETPRLAGAQPSRSVAGTQGQRVSLKTEKVYKVTDLRAASEFIAKMNAPPEAFIEGLLTAAELLIKAGVEVPGVEVTIKEIVA
jgi:hypothetical protein